MSAKTEILSAPEIKQSDIETKIYDRNAQFYEYRESEENKTIVENENRSSRRIILTGSLAALGGLILFGGLATAFFYFSEKMFQSAAVNQIGAKNLQKDENDTDSTGKAGTAENGFEPEKPVKQKLPEDKNSAETVVKKEILNPTETKTVNTAGQNDKISLANRNLKELPKTRPESSFDSTSKTTNANFTRQNIRKAETPVVQSNESNREFWTISTPNKNNQTQLTPRQNQRLSQTPNNSGGFRDLPKSRQEFIVKKIKQSNPEQRSNIRERLQKKRRKN